MIDTDWFSDKIPYIPGDKWMYKLACFITGHRKDKLSYRELYLLLMTINKAKLGTEMARIKSMNKIVEIHDYFVNKDEKK